MKMLDLFILFAAVLAISVLCLLQSFKIKESLNRIECINAAMDSLERRVQSLEHNWFLHSDDTGTILNGRQYGYPDGVAIFVDTTHSGFIGRIDSAFVPSAEDQYLVVINMAPSGETE